MQTVSLSSSPIHTFSLYNHKPFLSLQSPRHRNTKLPNVISRPFTPALNFRFSIIEKGLVKNIRRKSGVVCYGSSSLTPYNLQWIATIASVVLMFAKGTGVQKSFLVPLFALQAPVAIVSFIKEEYGIWSAFLALLVRLFFFIPAELELPFVALLLVIVAPSRVMNLRGTQEGAIVSLVIAGYLAFQHFSRAGSLKKAFEQGSIIATIALICLTAISGLLLI